MDAVFRPSPSLAHRFRVFLIKVHRWIGLILGAWLLLVALTGSLMAWRGEITGLELGLRYPLDRREAGKPMLTVPEAQQAVIAAYPFMEGRDSESVTIPHSEMPFYAFVQGRGTRRLTILVDPYSGRVHQPINLRSHAMGTIQQLHTRLLSGFRGYVANGALACIAVVLLLTGLYVWVPSTVKQFKARLTIKRGVSTNRTLYDLHNVAGIYLYPILIILAVTAPILVGEHLLRDGPEDFARNWATNGEQQGGERGGNRGERGGNRGEGNRAGGQEPRGERAARSEGAPRRGEGPQIPTVEVGEARLSDADLIAAAPMARPGREVSRVRRSAEPDRAYVVGFTTPLGFGENESLFLNPYTGAVVEGPAASGPQRPPLVRVSRHLHFGEYGGVFSKSVYTIAGLLPLTLWITGLTLWVRKRRRRASALPSDLALEPVAPEYTAPREEKVAALR